MKYIDVHSHIYAPPYSIDELVREYRRLGIEKVCLSALGEQYEQPGSEAVKEAFGKYPDAVVGFGYFRLGVDEPDLVDRFYKDGFKGIKVISPKKKYSDKDYYPVYAKASGYGMPILFHTGPVARKPRDGEFDTASERMRPVYLDAISRAFPELVIIGAHLGVCWYQEACTVATNPNVYFDLSGIMHYIHAKPKWFFESIVFWEKAKDKLVFGVDDYYYSAENCIAQYYELLDTAGFSQEQKERLFYGNMAEILGMKR